MIFESVEHLREMAARLFNERRRRDIIFADRASLFGEPAWDILLELFAQPSGREIAAIDVTGPRSTQERFLLLLEAEGFVQREIVPYPNREHVTLTAVGTGLMTDYLLRIGLTDVVPGR